jgi:excisionase family DNA binding protein
MTTQEVAKYLKLSKTTVYRWARRGYIPSIKIAGKWMFSRDSLDAWLRTRKEERSNGTC